jgi:hypothetical protein
VTNTSDVECITCGAVDQSPMVSFDCAPDDACFTCVDCFVGYAFVQLDNNAFVYTAEHGWVSNGGNITPKQIHSRLPDAKLYGSHKWRSPLLAVGPRRLRTRTTTCRRNGDRHGRHLLSTGMSIRTLTIRLMFTCSRTVAPPTCSTRTTSWPMIVYCCARRAINNSVGSVDVRTRSAGAMMW